MFSAQHVSISIRRSPHEVYQFASNALNLPQWASGLTGSTITKKGDAWICESPMGLVSVKFAEKNALGVMDHDVTLPSGEVNYNPFRVLANDQGSEVVFTLYRRPRMSDADFEQDKSTIRKDLERLKYLLET